MANYTLNKTVYQKNIYENVIDTSFVSNTPPPPLEDTVTVEQFFTLYSKVFYDIPVEGEINSHEYLVKRSSEYANFETTNNDIQALIDEINILQQQNLELNQQLVNLQVSSSKA